MFEVNYCDYNWSNPDHDRIYRPEGREDYLFLCFFTPMRIHLGDAVIETRENACILYTPDTPQDYEAIEKFRNSFFHFTSNQTSFIEQFGIPVNTVFYLQDVESVNRTIKKICIENIVKQDFYKEQTNQLVTQLLIDVARQVHVGSNDDISDDIRYEQFRNARVEILTHIEENWTTESMAALTNLGVSQFYSIYRQYFSRSPKAELLDARIERAKYLLKIEKMPVTQTAILCGFGSLSHFTRYFKKKCKVTPKDYAR